MVERRERAHRARGSAGRETAAAASAATRASASTRAGRDALTIEHIVAVESPREFRLHPRERLVAYTAEAAGARQVFSLPLRGGFPRQLTASEEAVSDPQWSPDGRRIAFVRKDAIWTMEADGSRLTRVTEHPAGTSRPRWSPDGRQLAFVSRRRGWSQVWLIDAPVPRRGRPAAHPRPPEPRVVTPAGLDVEEFDWSPDGSRLAAFARAADDLFGSITVVDVAPGGEARRIGTGNWESGGRWLPDGSLLFVSDADGWFQVVRLSADGQDRVVLTSGEREHGEPSGGFGFAPLPSPDGTRFTFPEVYDGFMDLLVAPIAGRRPRRGRGRPPGDPVVAAGGRGRPIQPWSGLWRAVDWTADGAWVLAIGESEARPQDLWLLPVPDVAPAGAAARQVTDSLPAVLRPAFTAGVAGERIAFPARDGLRIEG
ncbi:MAG TPA: DPP IV N-terminal domain-containing protein, partial [Candidatus Limnocylindrales bacterium]